MFLYVSFKVPFDSWIIGNDHTKSAMNKSDARNDSSGVNFLFAIQLVASKCGELQKG